MPIYQIVTIRTAGHPLPHTPTTLRLRLHHGGNIKLNGRGAVEAKVEREYNGKEGSIPNSIMLCLRRIASS
jgi:hypothetical protein